MGTRGQTGPPHHWGGFKGKKGFKKPRGYEKSPFSKNFTFKFEPPPTVRNLNGDKGQPQKTINPPAREKKLKKAGGGKGWGQKTSPPKRGSPGKNLFTGSVKVKKKTFPGFRGVFSPKPKSNPGKPGNRGACKNAKPDKRGAPNTPGPRTNTPVKKGQKRGNNKSDWGGPPGPFFKSEKNRKPGGPGIPGVAPGREP